VSKRFFDLARPSRQHWLGYILLLPAVALVALIIVYPLFVSLDLSFQKVGLTRLDAPRKPFTLENYNKLFSSPEFWMSCWVTIKLVVVVSVFCFLLGLGTALLVNNRFRGRTLARLFVALPWAVPEVIAVVIFAWIFDSSFGLMNWLLIQVGLSGQMINWFSDPAAAFWVVAVTMVWKGYPFVSIMTLAGLVVLWVFRDFSIIKVLTDGGPLRTTQTLSIMTYEQAFGFFNMGYASAIGIVTLILCVVASLLMLGRKTQAMY
jgi:multiple sugar transport system permease protein